MTEDNMTAEDYFYRGVARYFEKNYDGAIEDYTKAIELKPEFAMAYYNRGVAKAKKQDYDSAIVDYDEAIKIDDKYALAYYNRGVAKDEKQDYDGAIADYTRAIELNPNNAGSYGNRGVAKAHKKDYDGAIIDFTRVLELNPDDAMAYFNRGNAKDKTQDYDGAIADYTRVLELNPDDAMAYFNRGNAKDKTQDYDGAIADYTRAIELNPDDADGYVNRGSAKFKKQDYDSAIADYTRAIELNPDYANAYYCRGIAKDEKEDFDGAMNDYKKVFSLTNYLISSTKIFYRFRPLNQYTLEAFILNNFFVADPETFNDPFDTLLLRQEEEEKIKFPETLKKFNDNIRIASLASRQDKDKEKCPLENILLWSYYAQDHKGIAIGYKFNSEKFNQHKAFLKNVHYRKELIQNNWNNLFEEAYLAKFENWRHEQEWRFVYLKEDDDEDPVLLDMTDWGIEIAEIIFGWKCPPSQREMIYQLFKQKNLDKMPDFYKMERTDNNIFGLKKKKWEI